MHYSAYGNFSIKEHYNFDNLKNNNTSMGNFGLSEADKQAMRDESNKRGTSSVNQSSTNTKKGGTMITKENENIEDIKTTSQSDSTYIDKVDITKIEKTNKVIKSKTKKMKDSFSSSETSINPFNVYDKKIEVDTFPYYLQKTSKIKFDNYLGLYVTFTTGDIINGEEMLINLPSGYTCGINLYNKKITPFIALWWGDDKSKFLTFEKYANNIPFNDDQNNYQYTCVNSSGNKITSFATYNHSTLTEEQKEIINSKYPGKPDSYYACVQGCPGTCSKGINGVNETHLWNKDDLATNQKSLSQTYNYEILPKTIYRCYAEFDMSIPGETTIYLSLKNLSNGNSIFTRKPYSLKNVNISGYSTNEENIAIGQKVPWDNDAYKCKCNLFTGKIHDVKISRRNNSLTQEQVKKLMDTGESKINSDFLPEQTFEYDISIGAKNNSHAEFEIKDKTLVNKIIFEYKGGGVTCSGSNMTRYGCSSDMIAVIMTRHNNKEILPSKKVNGYSRLDVDGAHWYKIKGIDNNSPSLVWDLHSSIELPPGLYKIWYSEDLTDYTLGDNSGTESYKMKIYGTIDKKKSACEILNKIANEPQIASHCSKVPYGFPESGQIKCCKDGQMPDLDYFITRNTAGKFKEGTHETIKTNTWEECQQKCKEKENCLAFEHYSENNDCALKTSWMPGSDNLDYFRPSNDYACGGDCSKWNSGIKYIHKSTCSGNDRPKCSLYGNPKLANCEKCSDLYLKGVGLICQGCGPVTAMLGERNLLQEKVPDYGVMAGRGFSVIILDGNYVNLGCAQFDTHGNSNASFMMVTWLNEKVFNNNEKSNTEDLIRGNTSDNNIKYVIFLVWDEALHRLKSDHRKELSNKFGILKDDIKLEYRSPYAALVKIENDTSEVMGEVVHSKYSVPAVISIKCFMPDDIPKIIFSNYHKDKFDLIDCSRRAFKNVRALDEIHVITKLQTPSNFDPYNDIMLYGSDDCCGGFFIGLKEGKLFLGNQCNSNLILGPKLEEDKRYSLEFYYNKITKKCKILVDSDIVVEKENVDYEIPGGLLTLGTGCHKKDHENWGHGSTINCGDYTLYGDKCYGEPGITKDLVKEQEMTLIGDSYHTVSKNYLVKDFDINKSYKLDMIIHPTGKIGGWSNIIHSTLSGNNCCGSKDRLPGIWFRSNTTRLHIRTSTMRIGNDGFDPPIDLPLNKDTRLIIIVDGNTLKIELSGAVSYSHTHKISSDRYGGRVKFYASDPWYNSSITKIKNVKWTNIMSKNNNDDCIAGNCQAIYEKCKKEGGHVASKEEIKQWISNGGSPPRAYGITTTKRTNNSNESLSGHKQAGYKGNQNKTISGKTCQNWRCYENGSCTHTGGSLSSYVQKNKNNSSWNDTYGIGNHNYCRNPDGEPRGIWCYTTDKSKRWEYCDPLPNLDDHWLEGHGWHFDGCCGNNDRYYVCAKSGEEITNNDCRPDDIGCLRKRQKNSMIGIFESPITPKWKSGHIYYIKIYDRYFSEEEQKNYTHVPRTPDNTNMLNFEKDVKCEDLCDIGIEGDKKDSWLCRTSKPLSELRCCKVEEGQWCPNAKSIVNMDVGTITMESSGSNRCCCGEVSVEEDLVETGATKEERITSLNQEFKSMYKENKTYSRALSNEVLYYDADGNPVNSLEEVTESNNIKNLSGYTYRGNDVKCSDWQKGRFGGSDESSLVNSANNIDDCSEACNKKSECGGFYFNPSSKKCWLENGNCENIKSDQIHYKKRKNFVILNKDSPNISDAESVNDQSKITSYKNDESPSAMIPTSDEIVTSSNKSKKKPKPKSITVNEDSGGGSNIILIIVLLLIAIYLIKKY